MERVADYIIRTVKDAGAKHIFMITGRGILYLTDAVAKEKGIVAVSPYHEQSASYAAMAYSSITNAASACLVSTGCAAANAITAVLCAYQDNLPVVFISGNHMLKETTRYTQAPIRTYGSQEADIISLVKPITKYAAMLTCGEDAVYEVEKALYLAGEGRKGPVWIDVPLDVQNMRIEPGRMEHFQIPCRDVKKRREVLKEEAKTVASELSCAQRPVILIGGGIACADAGGEIKMLVERGNLPLTFSPGVCDVYGTSHDLSIGSVGSLGGTRAGNFAVQNADYILAVGTKLCSQETGRKDAFARAAKITVVDIDEKEHQKDGVHIERFIHADAKEFLEELLKQNIAVSSSRWADTCRHWKSVFAIGHEKFVQELKENDRLDIYSVMDMVSPCLPQEATVITDAGFEELIVPSCLRFGDGQRCLFPASQGAMGYALPAVIGAYFAGRKQIIVFVGDGSFMMNMQELEIIRDKNIPVRIVVISNYMYAVIRKRQKDLFRTRTIGNDPTDGVPAPDFRKIAECFGFAYKKIHSRSELEKCKDQLLSGDEGREIIEILCTPDQNYLHESYAVNEKKRLVHRPIEDMSPFLDREVMRREMIIDMVE